MMWQLAIEQALVRVKRNIPRFSQQFPIVSNKGIYQLEAGEEWTSGFWPGILWLAYQYSGDVEFRRAGEHAVELLRERMLQNQGLEHHDLGFLYSLSAKAQWIITRDEDAKKLTLQAADAMLKRWRPSSQLIQAWGKQDDLENGGRIIIDCLMNLPLLFWASEQTGNSVYAEVAIKQANKSRRYLVRGDDSSYHTFYFHQETGIPLCGGTHQGYQDGSTWSRGQAWGIYGFALAYRYTKDPLYLATSKRMAQYFIKQLPDDYVAYWDFSAPVTNKTPRDSSASAIAAAGILELISLLAEDDADIAFFQHSVVTMMESLMLHYTPKEAHVEGLLVHGSYDVRKGYAADDCMIWGDYFYLEALVRLEKGITGYWYEVESRS